MPFFSSFLGTTSMVNSRPCPLILLPYICTHWRQGPRPATPPHPIHTVPPHPPPHPFPPHPPSHPFLPHPTRYHPSPRPIPPPPHPILPPTSCLPALSTPPDPTPPPIPILLIKIALCFPGFHGILSPSLFRDPKLHRDGVGWVERLLNICFKRKRCEICTRINKRPLFI